MMNIAEKIRTSFDGRKVVIVGDVVADQFLHGSIARVSREAPVFILRHDSTDTCPGGAANAAANVAALGGVPVLIGITGTDENGRLLRESLAAAGVDCETLVADEHFKTTTKVRVLAGQDYAPRQQVIRIDYENDSVVSGDIRERLIDNLRHAGTDAAAIIVSDYNYGVAESSIVDEARRISRERGVPLVVDSRFRLREFSNATSATPNQEEVEMILGKGFTDEGCIDLRRALGYESLLVTCGNDGMLLVEDGVAPLRIPAVGSRQPIDVTGAGDTVIAAYALGLASGLSFAEAAAVANHAGGIVVMKKGTTVATREELLESLTDALSSPVAVPIS
ncbi:MAG: bifunctional heptose 7-phosphate kinase/heptose 1-phosphate adenyltransferase [Pyrinomonadaceae bacterium]